MPGGEVDGERFEAGPGSLVYMKPNAVHQLEVISDERIVVVWADWAPDGDKSVHDAGFKILAPVPQQPESAKIALQQ